MKLRRILICGLAGLALIGGKIFAAGTNTAEAALATPPVYAPDTTHQTDPLPDGVLGWDALVKETNVMAGANFAYFNYSFTNLTSEKIAILDVKPGCSCTTAQLPPLPWVLEPGTNGQFGITVNIAGHMGVLYKTTTVRTDKGFKQLIVKINIVPAAIPAQTDAERAQAVEIAKANRQAIFSGDCMGCHVKPGEGQYGKNLYDSDCAICHDGAHRAGLVPDLHQIKTPTNQDYWQTWIAHGKAGSLMPAFSTPDGGPLSDMQIMSLVQYLSAAFPSQAAANQ